MAYGKIFESLFTGSMVGAGCNVFALWSYVIANSKPPGTIELNPVLLSTVFGCSVVDVEKAIEALCAPDPRSRTKDHDGRRLLREGEYLYSIPTWPKYNAIRNEIERREQNREAQRRWRERQKSADVSDDLLTDKQESAASAALSTSTSPSPSGEGEPERGRARKPDPLVGFQDFWNAYNHKKSIGAAERAWRKLAPDASLTAKIVAAARIYRVTHPDETYRKHAATWLNSRCWEDAAGGAPETVLLVHPRNMPVPYDSPTGNCECQACISARAKRCGA